MKAKEALKKFWQIVWKDDSPKGWIISVIFLFIIIKFVFFPILSLTTGTTLPLAIVESCSMYHDNNLFSSYDTWWENHEDKYSEFDLTKEQFEEFIFKKGFNKGDILFILGTDPEDIEIGDVIIFQSSRSTPIIHRVIKIKQGANGKIFETIGDNNNGQISFEKEIQEHQIIGRATFKLIPYVGWIKLVFYEPFRPSSEKGVCYEN